MTDGKTVRLEKSTYEKTLKLKNKLETDNGEILSMDKAINAAVDYLLKNYKEINQSDQLDLKL